MGRDQDGRRSPAEYHRDRCSSRHYSLFYINDIDDGITSSLLEFADDTKLLILSYRNTDEHQQVDD